MGKAIGAFVGNAFCPVIGGFVGGFIGTLVGGYVGRYDLKTGNANYSKCKYKINLEKVIEFVRENLNQQDIENIEKILGYSIERFYKKEFLKYHEKMYQGKPIYLDFC